MDLMSAAPSDPAERLGVEVDELVGSLPPESNSVAESEPVLH